MAVRGFFFSLFSDLLVSFGIVEEFSFSVMLLSCCAYK